MTPSLVELEQSLSETLLVDRHRLRRELRSIRDAERAGRPFDRSLTRLQRNFERSHAAYEARAARKWEIAYDDQLPVVQRKDELAAAIRDHQVIIVCGETGSGKSTQLPKICLELGRGVAGTIGHTQPRRIAARSVATRIAEELKVSVGREVGFQVRFQDATGPSTQIKLMTDGVLLAETQSDRWLNQYDTLIIDEAHERSLNIDFLLGYLHGLLPRRPELKMIVTSATIDAQRFADHFRTVVKDVPVFEVSGRMYPVEVLYRPPVPDEDTGEIELQSAIADAVQEVTSRGPGDVLVFLPTEREIHETVKTLKGRTFGGSKPDLLPLYARLSTAEQQKVFQTSNSRRIILSTNVAESSLTVPGIRYVVDTGTARISRYSPRSKLQRLPIEAVAQASADQRAGRCGRIGPGVCIRLFAEEDYQKRERYTAPEILRSNLAAVILQTQMLGLGHIEDFPFLEAPKSDAIRDGYKTLFELGAAAPIPDAPGSNAKSNAYQLTDLGRQLGRLPVDPRIGRIILAGADEGCLNEILILAAVLEAQDPRDRPLEKQQAADEAHAQFRDEDSDFLGLLKLWDFYHQLKETCTRSQLKKACQQNFLSMIRMKEWLDIHRELVDVVTQAGLKPTPRKNQFEPIHRALLTGFLSSIAQKTESAEYLVAGSQKAFIWPGSGVIGKKPKWIVAGELVETTRKYLRTVARIDPNWLEPLAEHLVTRTYSEPHWSAEMGAAMAWEKVTLFGLTIVPRRRIRYQKIDPAKSRELFLQHALVEGDVANPPDFLQFNRELIAELTELQERSRRGQAVRDDDAFYEFYDQRIPAEFCDLQRLTQWLKQSPKAETQRLWMTEDDVFEPGAAAVTREAFPDTLETRGLKLPLVYKLDPGSSHDGVTLTVPQPALNQLDRDRLGWLVPGLVEEKVSALLRSLPKDLRRDLVPIPDTARQIAAALKFGEGALIPQICAVIDREFRKSVPASAFDETRLPDHLRLQVAVVDAAGKPIAEGRDVVGLQKEFGGAAAASFTNADDPRWQRDGLTSWNFGTLPQEVSVKRAGVVMTGYPTLIDSGETVSLRLVDTLARAEHELRFGVRRLACLALKRELKQAVDRLPQINAWSLAAPTFPQPCPMRQHITELIADRACFPTSALPRSETEFRDAIVDGHARLATAIAEVSLTIGQIVEAFTTVRKTWKARANPAWEISRKDEQLHLGRLLAPGFLVRTPWPWLLHYARYVKTISQRLDKLAAGGHLRDQQLLTQVRPRWARGQDRKDQHAQRHVYDPELELYLGMAEEYRVATFAQELGTAMSVSDKRLDKQWEKVAE